MKNGLKLSLYVENTWWRLVPRDNVLKTRDRHQLWLEMVIIYRKYVWQLTHLSTHCHFLSPGHLAVHRVSQGGWVRSVPGQGITRGARRTVTGGGRTYTVGLRLRECRSHSRRHCFEAITVL